MFVFNWAIITNRARFITNRHSYYKYGQLLQIGAQQRELKPKVLFKSFEKLWPGIPLLENFKSLDYNL